MDEWHVGEDTLRELIEAARSRSTSKDSRYGQAALTIFIGVMVSIASVMIRFGFAALATVIATVSVPGMAILLTKIWVLVEAPLLLFVRRSTTHDAALATCREVTLLSLNIFMRGMVSHPHGDFKDQRLAWFIANIIEPRRYTVICLQEMFCFGSLRRARLLRAARLAGYHAVRGSVPWLFNACALGDGLVVLSLYPIVESDVHVFSVGTHEDVFAQKGVLYAKLRLPGQAVPASSPSSAPGLFDDGERYVHVFNTHLQASYSLADAKARAVQTAQLGELQRFVRAKQLSGLARGRLEPALLAGDFNINSRGADWGRAGHAELQTLFASFCDTLHASHPDARLLPATSRGVFTHAGDGVCSTALMCAACARDARASDMLPVDERLDYVLFDDGRALAAQLGVAAEALVGACEPSPAWLAHRHSRVEPFMLRQAAADNQPLCVSDHAAVIASFDVVY